MEIKLSEEQKRRIAEARKVLKKESPELDKIMAAGLEKAQKGEFTPEYQKAFIEKINNVQPIHPSVSNMFDEFAKRSNGIKDN